MAKNNNLTIWIIVGLVVAIFFLHNLGLFSISLAPQGILSSNYIIKAGLIAPITTNCAGEVFCSPEVNSFITNFYGVGIFDAPITLDTSTRQNLIQYMQDENSQALEQTGYITPIFSTNFINLVSKNSFSSADLITLKNEIDLSATNFCNAIKYANKSGLSSDIQSEYSSIINYCNSKPLSIFTQNGNTYTLNLNDFTETITTSSECYIDSSNNQIICPTPTTQTQIIPLSQIKLQISSNQAGSIIVAIGNKGIAEANNLISKYEFDQYAYSLDNNNSIDFSSAVSLSPSSYPAYTVISNNQNVVDASYGKIKNTGLMDLWYGIKGGKAYTDWRFWLIIGGILLLLIIIIRR